MTFFLVIDLVLRIFPFFSHIFRMITVLNVVYDHFLTRKTQFSLCSCFHAHPTTLLLKILGGPMHGRSPTSNFWGDRPPSPPRSPPLRCSVEYDSIKKPKTTNDGFWAPAPQISEALIGYFSVYLYYHI